MGLWLPTPSFSIELTPTKKNHVKKETQFHYTTKYSKHWKFSNKNQPTRQHQFEGCTLRRHPATETGSRGEWVRPACCGSGTAGRTLRRASWGRTWPCPRNRNLSCRKRGAAPPTIEIASSSATLVGCLWFFLWVVELFKTN